MNQVSKSFYAIDFGTSNSLLNYIPEHGEIKLIPLENNKATLRTILFTPSRNEWYFGEEAITQFQEDMGEGRFIRSVKKFLPHQHFEGTTIHGKKYKVEEVIAIFLKEMKQRADKIVGENVTRLILGRPALYSPIPEEDSLAQERMLLAAKTAGFQEIIFFPEPLAAGLNFIQNSNSEKLVLVADFGGGTSDFTLLKMRRGHYSPDDVLGMSGVFLAGDSFDGSIMQNFIAKYFGRFAKYKTPFSDLVLDVPRNIINNICTPAYLVRLMDRNTMELLNEIKRSAVSVEDKNTIENLITLVEYQLGYPIFGKIEKSKIALSSDEVVNFNFSFSQIKINDDIKKIDFESCSQDISNEIFRSLDQVFIQSGLKPSDVDKVCITGGTGQLPLIKNRLSEMFGEQKVMEHNIFQSVVDGLAVYAAQLLKKPTENNCN